MAAHSKLLEGTDLMSITYDPSLSPSTQDRIKKIITEMDTPELRGDLKITSLSGGASNVNVRIDSPAGSYVLRVCAPDAQRWGVDRQAALVAQHDAAALGLAPTIVASLLPEGHFLSEYIASTPVNSDVVRSEKLIPLVAHTLLELKKGSTTARDFSPFDDLRTFVELGDAEGANAPEDLELLLAACFRIEALFANSAAPRGFCHSDLVPQNFLLLQDRLMMVDFDYAGNGWVAFELGSFACQAELSDEETEQFLSSYDPKFGESERARVALMRLVAGVRDGAWALMAEPILGNETVPLDGWTYQKYAENNFAQARAVIDSGDFARYLKEARNVSPQARI